MFLIFSCIAFSQEDSLQVEIQELKDEIEEAKGGKKLILLDGLCELIKYKSEYQYDSIVKETIAHAINLGSVNIVGKHTADRIYFLAREGQAKKSVEVFNDFIKNEFKGIEDSIYARLYLNAALGTYHSGETKESIPYYQKASEYALKVKDSMILGKSKVYISDAYASLGQFAETGLILDEAQTIFERTKDTFNLMLAINSRANLYSRLKFVKEAKPIRNELIKLALGRKDYRMLQSAYYNMSIDDATNKDVESRTYNLKEALKYAKLASNISYEPKILIALLETYSESNKINEAKNILKTIKRHPQYSESEWSNVYSYIQALANFYLASADHKKAIELAEKLLKLSKNDDFDYALYNYRFLARAYEKDGNVKKSHEYYKIFLNFRDSIYREENVKALTYYQTLYETKKRDATIESQESEIALLDAESKIKSQWILFGSISLLVFFIIIFLLRSRSFALSKQVLQEQFSRELINEQEKERTRLARELHDSVGQKLMLLTKSTKKKEDTNSEKLASSTLEEVREIARGLHPSNLERLGLTESINALVYSVNRNTDLFFTDEIENIDNILSKESELHLYRIIQETLSNIVKHAEAKAVKMNIKRTKETVEVVVSDNGKGFDIETKYKSMSLGLKTLFERAKIMKAKINLNSNNGTGTVMILNIPI
ncbi:MAG: ATP-binding protein [Algibacter sp.]